MIEVVINTNQVKRLIVEFLRSKLGDIRIEETDILFQVMSKQNYRQKEWEVGDFKAIYRKYNLD